MLPPSVRAMLDNSQAPATAARSDGWSSIITGLGTRDRDKRTSVTFGSCVVTDLEARDLWRGDDLAARAVEAYPDEMLRAGYDVCVSDDEDVDGAREKSEKIEDALKEIGADESVRTALCYERAYGGGAIFPVINDLTGDLAKPLIETSIASIKRLVTFEPQELQAVTYYNDPTDPKYGYPETYRLQPISVSGAAQTSGGVIIHESRLIIFPGVRVSRAQIAQRAGWGDSILTRVVEVIRDFNAGFTSTSVLLQDFAQAVYRIQGLHDAVAADDAKSIVLRMKVMDLSRSIVRGIMLDAGDSQHPAEGFERQVTPLTGVSDVLDRMIYRLASALEMPASLLMGMSPAGLNATGDGDRQAFYDRVAQKQDRHLRPRLERLIRLMLLSKDGPTRGQVPEQWSVEFCPLQQASQKEIVEARKVQAEIDVAYINAGVVMPEDVAESRFGGDGYSFETKVDFKLMEKMRAAEEERAKQIAAAGAIPPVARGEGAPTPVEPRATGEDNEEA